MCRFCLNKQIGDKHYCTIQFSSALNLHLFQYELNSLKLFFKLADWNTYSYESTQYLFSGSVTRT